MMGMRALFLNHSRKKVTVISEVVNRISQSPVTVQLTVMWITNMASISTLLSRAEISVINLGSDPKHLRISITKMESSEYFSPDIGLACSTHLLLHTSICLV